MRTFVWKFLLVVVCAGWMGGLFPGSARAHAIDHREDGAAARVLEVFYADGRPFGFENFEVTGPGDRSPYMIGRTDRLGRVVFLPDRPGEWAIRVWSEDGHGLTTTLRVEDIGDSAATEVQGDDASVGKRRLIGLAVGLGVISALGATLFLQARRKQS